MLGCVGKGLPFDQVRNLGGATPSNEYILYVFEPCEVPGEPYVLNSSFMLVHVLGERETILDTGKIPHGFRTHTDTNYTDVNVVGQKLGHFKFYLSVGLRLKRPETAKG